MLQSHVSSLFAFGKRKTETLKGRKVVSHSFQSAKQSSSALNIASQKFLLDYIISHAASDRSYLQVSVITVTVPMLALLDSGASTTVAEQPGYDRFLQLGLSLIPAKDRCTVANKQSFEVLGFIQAPITLMEMTKIVDI